MRTLDVYHAKLFQSWPLFFILLDNNEDGELRFVPEYRDA